MYLVIVAHTKGAYIPETDLKHADRVTVCKHIRQGQFTDILHVFELNLIAHTCNEVTHEFRDLIEENQRAFDRVREGRSDEP
jgi:hypothetical protein